MKFFSRRRPAPSSPFQALLQQTIIHFGLQPPRRSVVRRLLTSCTLPLEKAGRFIPSVGMVLVAMGLLSIDPPRASAVWPFIGFLSGHLILATYFVRKRERDLCVLNLALAWLNVYAILVSPG